MIQALASLKYKFCFQDKYTYRNNHVTITVDHEKQCITRLSINLEKGLYRTIDHFVTFVDRLRKNLNSSTSLQFYTTSYIFMDNFDNAKCRAFQRLMEVLANTDIGRLNIVDIPTVIGNIAIESKPIWNEIIFDNRIRSSDVYDQALQSRMRIDQITADYYAYHTNSLLLNKKSTIFDNVRFVKSLSFNGISLQRSWCRMKADPSYFKNSVTYQNQEYKARICTLLEATIQKEKNPARTFLFKDGDHHVMAKTLQFLLHPWL